MKTVIASGYFDPLHVGHLDYLKTARLLGDQLIVIVNNDEQTKLKKGSFFMPAEERVKILKHLDMIDKVIISMDRDRTVTKTIRYIHKLFANESDIFIFANGGDVSSCPEEAICKKLGMVYTYNVGGAKVKSSSELMERQTIPPYIMKLGEK